MDTDSASLCALPSCRRAFVPRRADARYCSGACRARASRDRTVETTKAAVGRGAPAASRRGVPPSRLLSDLGLLREELDRRQLINLEQFDDRLVPIEVRVDASDRARTGCTESLADLAARVDAVERHVQRELGSLRSRLDEHERGILAVIERLKSAETGVLVLLER